jgi:hypothetical protein
MQGRKEAKTQSELSKLIQMSLSRIDDAHHFRKKYSNFLRFYTFASCLKFLSFAWKIAL